MRGGAYGASLAEQNLPGLLVAVGVGGSIVRTEGAGWPHIETRMPVTPDTPSVTLRQLMAHVGGLGTDCGDEGPLFPHRCERRVEALEHFAPYRRRVRDGGEPGTVGRAGRGRAVPHAHTPPDPEAARDERQESQARDGTSDGLPPMVGSLMRFREAVIVVAVMSNISHTATPALAPKVAEAFAPAA